MKCKINGNDITAENNYLYFENCTEPLYKNITFNKNNFSKIKFYTNFVIKLKDFKSLQRLKPILHMISMKVETLTHNKIYLNTDKLKNLFNYKSSKHFLLDKVNKKYYYLKMSSFKHV